jgi:ATP-dependent DNA ligase
MLAYKAGDRVLLVSRNGRDHTRRFADLAVAERCPARPDGRRHFHLITTARV